jgi:hypothetical protein
MLYLLKVFIISLKYKHGEEKGDSDRWKQGHRKGYSGEAFKGWLVGLHMFKERRGP